MAGLKAWLLLLSCVAGTEALRTNPVTRVVELMQGLVKKIAEDGKAEEELYDKYVCWYQTVVSSKKASNEQAKDRIEALTAYIDDVKSGRVEFTSERKDLEAEIEKLNSDLETASAMRKREGEDYAAAKEEMEAAIAALEESVEVLRDGTKGSLTSVGFGLRRVVKMGKSMLSSDDVRFLEAALDGQGAPGADGKKLGQEAGEAPKYKAPSTKIQEILKDMLQTFKDNLADATKKEEDAKTNFETLSGSKQSQLSAAQDALSGGDAEGAARATSAEESQDEVDALTTQVESDSKFIAQAEEAYAAKASEWKERKRLRTGEAAAVSKAVAVLTSDAARDTMSASFSSQAGAMLLQESGCTTQRTTRAATKLREVAVKHNDLRLAALAVSVKMATAGHFDAIASSIDKMVSDLKAEYEEDLAKKESCQDDRMTNTKTAKQTAQKMDDQTALVNRQQAVIEEKQKEVEDIASHLKELNLQMEEAKVMRNKEKLEYEKSRADDKEAVALIQKSADVLAKFYKDEALAFLQTGRAVRSAEPGEAPAPPPATWSKPYGGAQGESSGIQSILAMVKEDVEKDMRTATDEENEAQSNFESFNSETLAMISNLESEKTKLEGEIGDAEDAIAEAKKTRSEKKKLLDQTLNLLRDIAPGCDFIAANFELRKANREAEIDGLFEAKASLQGGTFKGLLQKDSSGC